MKAEAPLTYLWPILCASLVLAGCSGSALNKLSNAPISEQNPGTSINIKNPDPGKWAFVAPAATAAAPATPGQPRPGFWVCKPLACSGAAAVSISTGRSPTRNPDKVALEKAAKLLPTQFKAQDLMMDAASEGDERITSLSSKVTTARGYPAIVAEAKRTSRRKDSFLLRADLFIGVMQVRVSSIAPQRAEAMKHFESFVAAMEIVDVEKPGGEPAVPASTIEPVAIR